MGGGNRVITLTHPNSSLSIDAAISLDRILAAKKTSPCTLFLLKIATNCSWSEDIVVWPPKLCNRSDCCCCGGGGGNCPEEYAMTSSDFCTSAWIEWRSATTERESTSKRAQCFIHPTPVLVSLTSLACTRSCWVLVDNLVELSFCVRPVLRLYWVPRSSTW